MIATPLLSSSFSLFHQRQLLLFAIVAVPFIISTSVFEEVAAAPSLDCTTCTNGYSDGCNDCYCDDNGIIACTQRSCFDMKNKNGNHLLHPHCLLFETVMVCQNDNEENEININTDLRISLEQQNDGGLTTASVIGPCRKAITEEKCEGREYEGVCFDCNACPLGYSDGCNHCYCDGSPCTDWECLWESFPACLPL